MSKRVGINSWLNDHLFRRPDLHPIFEALNKFGADLDYVLFLCGIFVHWDEMRRRLEFDRRRGLVPFSHPNIKLHGEKRLSEIGRPVCAHGDPERKGEGDMWLGKMMQILDAHSDALSKACIVTPLFAVFAQFGYPRLFFNAKGDPGDPWGNFFLLAVTEHLGSVRGTRGRGWRSKHDLAYRLLTMLRKGSVSIGNPKVSAAARVAAVKKNPKWRAALSLLESEFSKLTPSVGSASVK
jgi:hypothetical protein